MKLFAPKNDWSVASGTSWWPLMGSVSTTSGARVNEEIALTLSAVFAATRVISETMGSLPLHLLEQEDARTTRKAIDHPLYPLLHDQPNPEQDIMSCVDMQTALQVNYGNAYFEIQRNTVGRILALWPIHPSRIPLRNIRRNPTDPNYWSRITVGEPGEIVYYVMNDDNTESPIAAADMLHIPGVLSSNGVTGQSIIRWGANSIGVALATEEHAGAFFRNGAVSNVAIKSPKMVGKETADRLREQWQKTFAGVRNHYKTLLLEDGMEPVPFSISPENSQLLAARQFSVTEIARWYRLPPYLLGDLSRATYSNIESEQLSFITHSMLPWVIRWEKALNRQLLTAAEKKRYHFKFNMMGLLRGDSASRAAFYQSMFQMGSISPNDIREREDFNPIEGGDQYFVPANNLVPLDKIADYAQAQIDKLTEPTPAPQKPFAPQPAEDAGDAADAGDTAGPATNRMAELRRLQEELIAKVEKRDTSAAETLAVRETKMTDAERRVINALRSAIAARLTGLVEYEVRSVKQAAKKPQTFLTWQGEFYDEFRVKIGDALSPFRKPAETLGLTFDCYSSAAEYVGESSTWLAPLADVGCNELESAAGNIVATWANRPHDLAASIIPERIESCAA